MLTVIGTSSRGVDVLESTLQLGHQNLCLAPGFGERQLAELDPGARHQIPAPMRRLRLQTQLLQAGDQLVELVVGYVEDDQLLVGGEPDPVRTGPLGQVGDRRQDGAGHPPGDRGNPDGVEPVLEPLHADVIDRMLDRLGGRAVDQRTLEVLGFENFAELFDAPVLDQELQPCLGPQPPVAVVAEYRGHRRPHLGHLVERNPGADPLGQHRVGRQTAADPQVQARARARGG